MSNSLESVSVLLRTCVTPLKLIQTSLRVIEKSNKELNYFITTVRKEDAINQAVQSGERLIRSHPRSKLEGIPIAIKDNFTTTPFKTTCGSKILSNYHPSSFESTVFSKLVTECGAIIMGKTNMDEFAMGSGTTDSHYSPTINPWKSGYSCGGSSGGSAAAVASGSVFAAIGSDTGGSTRHPAALTGILGFKPTYGLISRYGMVALTHSMDTVGIMTKYAADAALLLQYLAGHDDKDSTSIVNGNEILERNGSFDPKMSLKGLKIGVPIEYEDELINNINKGCKDGEEILKLWKETSELLESNGAEMKRINLKHSKYVSATYLILNSAEVASNFSCYDGIEFGHRANEQHQEDDGKDAKNDEYVNGNVGVIKNEVRVGSEKFKTAKELFRETRKVFGSNVKSRILAGNYFLLSQNQENYLYHAMKVRRLIYQDFQDVLRKSQKDGLNEHHHHHQHNNQHIQNLRVGKDGEEVEQHQQQRMNDGNHNYSSDLNRVNCGSNNYNVRDIESMNRSSQSEEKRGNKYENDGNYGFKCDTNINQKYNYDDSNQERKEEVVDFILTPATLRAAVSITEWKNKEHDNQQQAMKEDYFTVGANLTGLPAVTFPVSLSKHHGLPLSLQLIGNHFTDFKLLSAVHCIQNLVKFPFLTFRDEKEENY